MANEQFIEHRFAGKSIKLIQQIMPILLSYMNMGLTLTVRQLYYRLVAANVIPNNKSSYKRIVNLLGLAREAGLIDWNIIEDRVRAVIYPSHWSNPKAAVEQAVKQFKLDMWSDQRHHVEVLVEKNALRGVLHRICTKRDVRLLSGVGYSSKTYLYDVAKRLEYVRDRQRKNVTIILLSDHDPSGIDMGRDLRRRLELYSRGSVNIRRLALNYDQVQELELPPNPTKSTDSREAEYIEQYGPYCYELDGIEPAYLQQLLDEALAEYIDKKLWKERYEKQEAMRADYKGAGDYPIVVKNRREALDKLSQMGENYERILESRDELHELYTEAETKLNRERKLRETHKTALIEVRLLLAQSADALVEEQKELAKAREVSKQRLRSLKTSNKALKEAKKTIKELQRGGSGDPVGGR